MTRCPFCPHESRGDDNVEHALHHLIQQQMQTNQLLERIVSDLPTQLAQATADLVSAVSDLGTRVSTDIQTLRDALAAANALTPAVEAAIGSIEANVAQLQGIDPATPPVVVEPVPAPDSPPVVEPVDSSTPVESAE